MNHDQPVAIILPASEWNPVLSDISQGIALRQALLGKIMAQAKIAEDRSSRRTAGAMVDEADAFTREYELRATTP